MESVTMTVQLFEEALQSLPNNLTFSPFLITDSLKEKQIGQIYLSPDVWIPRNFPEASGSVMASKRKLEFSHNQFLPQPKKLNVRSKTAAQPKPIGQVSNSLTNQSSGSVGSVTFGNDGLGNVICPLCQKKFTNAGNANRHFASSHGNILFKCHICDYNTSRKDSLKAHGMKKHGLTEVMARMMVKNEI